MRTLAIAIVLAALSSAPASVLAKARTVRIDVTSAAFAAPLQITDAEVLYRFRVWNGPGVHINGRPAAAQPGAFIDWRQGAVSDRPEGLDRYEVSFYVEGKDAPRLAYVVTYAYDPSSEHGYFFLPGPADANYRLNTSSIYHGVEGNWFYASSAWEKLIRPLIDEARAP